MRVSTLVVEGPLAYADARLRAARGGALGLQIVDIAHLAARLAGGFLRPASSEDVEAAVKAALEYDDYVELDRMRHLPGAVRAVAATLGKLWRSGTRLDHGGISNPRVSDLTLLERRVLEALPSGALPPPALASAAMARIRFAPAVIGPIEVRRARRLDPVWQPLVDALSQLVEVRFTPDGPDDRAALTFGPGAAGPVVVVCSDPRSEAVDAMRWVRALLASGAAEVGEVALAAADPGTWDEHVMALVRETGLPVRFSHGLPALATPDGQTCAALADVLSRGLSQEGVRRLLGRLRAGGALPGDWPSDPLHGVPGAATLTTTAQWAKALEAAAAARADGFDPLRLMPVLETLAQGPSAAVRAGTLLGRASGDLWERALRRSPPEAIALRLAELRTPDGGDAAATVSWGPASHLAAAPRRFVRLLGMVAGGWPRAAQADPLLPMHLFGGRRLETPTLTERDRDDFATILGGAEGGLVLSRAKRTAQGRVSAPSALLPADAPATFVGRTTKPVHACSEADRLLARLEEAAIGPAFASAASAYRGRRSPALNAWDGRLRPDHPAVLRALSQPQSATSLRLLLRDPLGFVWKYALGWRSGVAGSLALELDALAYGELVHELLHRTVAALEPDPGLAAASLEERRAALAPVVEHVGGAWPGLRATPPAALWRHTLAAAATLADRALAFDPAFMPGTRSWTELRFGQDAARETDAPLPWDETAPVFAPGTDFRLRGSIDRLDLVTGDRVRLSDYKTGALPDGDRLTIDRGRELQRMVYAIAARSNLPEVGLVVSRLIHLAADPPQQFVLKDTDLDAAVDTLAGYLRAGDALLRAGFALPGLDEARELTHEWRLALPAIAEAYVALKADAVMAAFGSFADVWRER